jgi:hypothetical protein
MAIFDVPIDSGSIFRETDNGKRYFKKQKKIYADISNRLPLPKILSLPHPSVFKSASSVPENFPSFIYSGSRTFTSTNDGFFVEWYTRPL